MRIVRVTTPEQLRAAYAVRTEVFVDEQGVAHEAEHDLLDDLSSTVHILALVDDVVDEWVPSSHEVLGTGRLLAPDGDGHPHIGRVAVVRTARRLGVGRAIMEALEEVAVADLGQGRPTVVELSAQVQAIPFYEAIGYSIHGEPYLDEGIWHRNASKRLGPPLRT